MFPVTAVVPKSLMPVANLPVLHYVLADLVAAGVRDIAIVVDRGDRAIREYVMGAPTVRRTLDARGWSAKPQAIAKAHAALADAAFTFIEQDVTGDYGTAVPARLAADFVAGRSCFYLSGDDLLMPSGGGSNVADFDSLRAAAADRGVAMQVAEVPPGRAHLYGMVEFRRHGATAELVSLAEKQGSARSSYANISRYYFEPAAFSAVTSVKPNPHTGELMITDALILLQQEGPVGVSVAAGRYFDCGSVDGWHQANVAMAASR